ncbi:hypothetical protein L1F06_012860 [Ectopseudomonas hydrolytica]|uniref:Plasmid-related protein n=1 Tax=Ectopseudomonas hydrolytica TaxID=2493633 RepID=A0ABY5A1G2_9GAMM|nr:hypothetical protein [Pseudomonas hydrolytica]USR37587.1 hypothetical protein L1F06_012860 [Pseudomonas hydrolytica]
MSTTTSNTPSQPIGNTRPALDEPAWQKICETAAAQARHGCGQSHDYYVERFSAAIDTHVDQLPEHQRSWALHIAIEEWGYATLAEREETLNWNAENGYCRHGIALDCCPAGCGSY